MHHETRTSAGIEFVAWAGRAVARCALTLHRHITQRTEQVYVYGFSAIGIVALLAASVILG